MSRTRLPHELDVAQHFHDVALAVVHGVVLRCGLAKADLEGSGLGFCGADLQLLVDIDEIGGKGVVVIEMS